MQIPIGKALTFTYGEPTGLFIGEDELRIGHEPAGYRVVLSKGKGEFPIRPVEQDGIELIVSDHAQAVKLAQEMQVQG